MLPDYVIVMMPWLMQSTHKPVTEREIINGSLFIVGRVPKFNRRMLFGLQGVKIIADNIYVHGSTYEEYGDRFYKLLTRLDELRLA